MRLIAFAFAFALAPYVTLHLPSSRCFAEAPEGAADAKAFEKLEPHDKKYLEDFRKELPQAYSVRPGISHRYSDDEKRVVYRLVSVTPIAPDGKPDGEERHLARLQTVRTVPYVEGRKHGMEMKYHFVLRERRRVRIVTGEIPWDHGKLQGLKKLYHHNGKLRVEAPYDKGELDGVSKEYDLTGRVVKVTPYRKGKRHGEMTEYWTLSGKPRRIIPYKNDLINGLVREFYDTGQLQREIPARKDLYHGTEKQYDEEGNLIKTVRWVKDERAEREPQR